MEQTIASWSMVMVHGLMVAGPGLEPRLTEIMGSQVGQGAGAFGNRKSNVGHAQANYLARPTTKSPETRIYFINHRSGAFLVPRVRTVVRGERASRSIVNRTTALWSIWVVASLILAGLGFGSHLYKPWGRGFVVSRGSNGTSNIDRLTSRRPKWHLPTTNG